MQNSVDESAKNCCLLSGLRVLTIMLLGRKLTEACANPQRGSGLFKTNLDDGWNSTPKQGC